MLEHLTTARIAAGTFDMNGRREPRDGNIRGLKSTNVYFFQRHRMLDALAGAQPYSDR